MNPRMYGFARAGALGEKIGLLIFTAYIFPGMLEIRLKYGTIICG